MRKRSIATEKHSEEHRFHYRSIRYNEQSIFFPWPMQKFFCGFVELQDRYFLKVRQCTKITHQYKSADNFSFTPCLRGKAPGKLQLRVHTCQKPKEVYPFRAQMCQLCALVEVLCHSSNAKFCYKECQMLRCNCKQNYANYMYHTLTFI